jgi:lysophospholipase
MTIESQMESDTKATKTPDDAGDSAGSPENIASADGAWLRERKDNPCPEGATAGKIRTPDGVSLRYARWRTTHPPFRGTAVLLQGRGEYIEKYYETVGNLREGGYDVLTFDWRGQGGSDRLLTDTRRGYVDSFDQYVADFDTILTDVALPDCRLPLFVLAHSTGSLVALLAAPGLANRVERVLLSSPLIRFGSTPVPQGWLKMFAGVFSAIGLGAAYLQPRSASESVVAFPDNVLTSDMRRFTRNAEFGAAFPELTIDAPAAAWLYAACQAMDRIDDSDFLGAITVPVLLVCAGNDKVVANRPAEEIGRRLRSGRTLTISGARHEMLQERDIFREQLLAAFRGFTGGDNG